MLKEDSNPFTRPMIFIKNRVKFVEQNYFGWVKCHIHLVKDLYLFQNNESLI